MSTPVPQSGDNAPLGPPITNASVLVTSGTKTKTICNSEFLEGFNPLTG